MRLETTLIWTGLAVFVISACSIDVNDHGDRVPHYDRYDEPRYGMRRVVLVEPFESRTEAGAAASDAMDRLRDAGCEIVSADRWLEIDDRDGPDLRGMRVAADCPQSARVY